MYAENKGDDTFQLQPLPLEAQWVPMYGFARYESNSDSLLKVLCVGNDYSNEPFIGPLEALQGLLLTFDHDGFTTMEVQKSVFKVTGNARDIITLYSRNKTYYVVTQNNGPLLIFTKK